MPQPDFKEVELYLIARAKACEGKEITRVHEKDRARLFECILYRLGALDDGMKIKGVASWIRDED